MIDFKKAKEEFIDCAYNIKYHTTAGEVDYKIIPDKNHLHIYFMGSDSIKYKRGWIDWVRNFWFFPARKKPYRGMEDKFYVHSGFLSAWKEIEDIVINEITKKDARGHYAYNKITIVGYSHGAALACLCHECCWYHRPGLGKDLLTYAFESPRVYGGFKTKKSLKERWETCFVFRNGNDLVTRCPPRIFGFSHVGNLVQINGDPNLIDAKVLKCIKYHYQKCVIDGLEKAAKTSK